MILRGMQTTSRQATTWHVRLVLLSLAELLGLALASGCASLSGGSISRVDAKLLANQKVELDGSTFNLDRLPGKLRSAGAGPDTAIMVGISTETPETDMQQVVRVLYGAGFHRVIFVGPRVTKATVEPAGTPPPTKR